MKFRLTVFAVFLTTLLCVTSVRGALVVSVTGDLDLVSGGDAHGLNTASFKLDASFTSGTTYFESFGQPAVQANSHSITITGATVGASNTTFSDVNGLNFYVANIVQFFDGTGTYLSGGPFSRFVTDSVLVSGVSVGDTVDTSHFGTSAAGSSTRNKALDDSTYAVSNFAISVSDGGGGGGGAIPEPASMAMFLVGGLGFVVIRRRRRN